jgi:hypothetical protein
MMLYAMQEHYMMLYVDSDNCLSDPMASRSFRALL